jgi:hypothetical protein
MGPYYILTFARWKKVESYTSNQDPMQLCLVCLEWNEMKIHFHTKCEVYGSHMEGMT